MYGLNSSGSQPASMCPRCHRRQRFAVDSTPSAGVAKAVRCSAAATQWWDMGDMYNLVERDDAKAVELFSRAADRGNATGMARLGDMYI